MCARCGVLEEEIVRIREAATLDFQNLQTQNMANLRTIGKLKAELAQHREEQPDSSEVKQLLLHARATLGKRSNWYIGMDGDRAKLAKTMLKRHGLAACKKAVDGLALKPHVGARGRSATPYPGSTRKDDLDHAIGTDKRVTDCIGYATEAEQPQIEVPKPRRPRDSDWSYARINPEDAVLSALEQHGCYPVEKGSGWQALCPAHDDHSPSLSVNWNGAGDRLLVHCWAGCETVYVMDALGLSLTVLFRDGRAA